MVYGIEVDFDGGVGIKNSGWGGRSSSLYSKNSELSKDIFVFISKLLCVYCKENYGVRSC